MEVIRLRLFIASPGDVSYERQIAQEVIEQIRSERAFRGRLYVEVIAWDKPGVQVPMEAGLTPQEAIARRLPKPSECDLVLVILWSRIGTPLPAQEKKADGSRYLSGTEWEYENAVTAFRANNKPSVWIYRRTEEPQIGLDDAKREDALRQWQLVKDFFSRFQRPDGSLVGGINHYHKPDDFRRLFEQHLRDWLTEFLQKFHWSFEASESDDDIVLWTEPPYPGLKALTEEQAPIFFGRGPEVDALVARLSHRSQRFLAVVGASGTGKSSLVMAGLIPELRKGAIPGSRDWIILPAFTPASERGPLCGLASAMVSGCRNLGASRKSLTECLEATPEAFVHLADLALQGRPNWAELLVFVDQFEELVTLVPEADREAFVRVLTAMARTPRVRTLITLRADLAHQADAWPALLDLRNGDGTYLLKQPGRHALRQIITRPAERAGVTLEDGLVDLIIEDTGTTPGSFALMAFTLERLYSICQPDTRLTLAAYLALDGVRGSISYQAEQAFSAMSDSAKAALPRVFRELVRVSPDGKASRRRTAVSTVARTAPAQELVAKLVDARLLLAEEDGQIEVAHDKLFEGWDRLRCWIGEYADDLRLIEKARLDAADWDKDGRAQKHLWTHEKLLDVAAALERLGISRDELDEVCRAFLRPEPERILDELRDEKTSHRRRAAIGDRLALIGDSRPGVGLGDNGLPDLVWCPVYTQPRRAEGKPEFYIAKYPVTFAQLHAYRMNSYLTDVDSDLSDDAVGMIRANRPAIANWHEAVAFCIWFTEKLRERPLDPRADRIPSHWVIRLPTEEEWLLAATGARAIPYPWGTTWEDFRANSADSRLNRPVSVGMYPSGAALAGALDMCGNVWEWCWDRPTPLRTGTDSDSLDTALGLRPLRGGSFEMSPAQCKLTNRLLLRGDVSTDGRGFRVCLAPSLTGEEDPHR